MQTKALRIYGKNDVRLESFELPELKDDEICAEVISNSICMSSYKAVIQGSDHKRIPDDIAKNPTLLGHEFSGTILKVGKKYKDRFIEGEKYGIQPALFIPGRELDAVGYTYRYVGGNATHIIIPPDVIEQDCLLPYKGEGFYKASLSEPMSCIIGAFKDQFHTGLQEQKHVHQMGIKAMGTCAILGGAGPMGLGAIDYALHGPVQPRLLVVTDIDQTRLDRAESIFTPQQARKSQVRLEYVNTNDENAQERLMSLTDNQGYDDVFVFAPVVPLIEQGNRLLAYDGCLNFFAGPTRRDFLAPVNFYDIHYSCHRIIGSTGGNAEDMQEALDLMGQGKLNPATMITHIGGLDAAGDTILNYPEIPGGKKLIYTQISMPLTALDDFAEKGKSDPFFEEFDNLLIKNNGLWSIEAEKYLLANAQES